MLCGGCSVGCRGGGVRPQHHLFPGVRSDKLICWVPHTWLVTNWPLGATHTAYRALWFHTTTVSMGLHNLTPCPCGRTQQYVCGHIVYVLWWPLGDILRWGHIRSQPCVQPRAGMYRQDKHLKGLIYTLLHILSLSAFTPFHSLRRSRYAGSDLIVAATGLWRQIWHQHQPWHSNGWLCQTISPPNKHLLAS